MCTWHQNHKGRMARNSALLRRRAIARGATVLWTLREDNQAPIRTILNSVFSAFFSIRMNISHVERLLFISLLLFISQLPQSAICVAFSIGHNPVCLRPIEMNCSNLWSRSGDNGLSHTWNKLDMWLKAINPGWAAPSRHVHFVILKVNTTVFWRTFHKASSWRVHSGRKTLPYA